MRKPRRTAVFAVGIAAALGAGAPVASAVAAPADPAHSQRAVTAGQSLKIALPAPNSGSTGYHWNVSTFAPGTLVRRTSERFSGNRQVFTYRTGRPGVALLQFAYVPPGRGAEPVKRLDFKVVVNRPVRRLRCYPPGSRTVISNGKVRVFKLRRSLIIALHSRDYVHYDAYFGCDFRRDRAHPLDGSPNSSDTIGESVYQTVKLNGRVTGYLLRANCPYTVHLDGGCTEIGALAAVSQNLTTGRVIRRVYASDAAYNQVITGLVLSARGGLAWIEFHGQDVNSVHRSDQPGRNGGIATDNQELDNGEHGFVDPDSLHAEGDGFRWKNRGIRRHASLR
jgi:hypothetical protein